MVIVRIIDTTRIDTASQIIEERIMTGKGTDPLPFTIAYDSHTINDEHTYVISIRITSEDGRLRFISPEAYNIITRGNPTRDISVKVQEVN